MRAAWATYEKERLAEALEKNRNLVEKPSPKPPLSCCDWKWIPLYCSLEEHKEYALSRPNTGRCTYERIPTIVVTNEDGEHFRLLEVRKILAENEISEIRQSRDMAQEASRKWAHRYHIFNLAAREGQTPAERLATDRARGYWAVEQQKRDATYIDGQHDEANELELLKRQIKREVDQYFKDSARSSAKARQKVHVRAAKAAQVEHFANLKLRMAQDNLIPKGAGHYIGPE